MIDETMVDGVRVLRMDEGQNLFNGPFVKALDDALASAGAVGGPLVLTGTGKTFSAGLDLDWIASVTPDEGTQLLQDVYGILARLLRFPGATVAALNGHAFGAGAILAAAADFRVQRADRGYLCFPEVDLGLALSDEFDAVVRAKLPSQSVLHALLTGTRYGGEAALAAGLVDAVATEDRLLDAAVDLVRGLVGKAPATVAAIKAQQHKVPLAVLDGAA